MRISLLGPTNLDKFSEITGLSQTEIEEKAVSIGRATANKGHELVVVFNYKGMLKLVGDSHKAAGGKLVMLQPSDDKDWHIEWYVKHLEEADIVEKCDDWMQTLLKLIDSPVVICAGLSAGVMAELAYMKWNIQESKGNCKKLLAVKDLLRDNRIPPEFSELEPLIEYVTSSSLESRLLD